MDLINTISRFPQCGVGNKLLYYWNLRQKSNANGYDWDMVSDADINSIIDIQYPSLNFDMRKHMELPFCLGENFFNYTKNRVPIGDIFKLKFEKTGNTICTNFEYCYIHLRGGDFRFWKNGEGMLSLDYYWNSLNHIIKIAKKPLHIQFITDDKNHPHLLPLSQLMDTNDINYGMHPLRENDITNDWSEDWYTLAHADYIISSPSTFAITAGMISNAYITHSKEWVDKRVSENDSFWVGLNNGGNNEYKAVMI